MQNYFENEITRMEKEILWLKTSAVKSGTVITSQVKTVDFNIPLDLVTPTNATGTVRYKITLDDNAIFNSSLNVYFDDIVNAHSDTRRRAIETCYLSENVYLIKVSAWGDSDDRDTLSGGGTVTISGKLTVTCTDDFTLEAI